MHSLLENYLNEVAAQLEPLPVKRRNEELREMRQHLLNAVIVNREMGQSGDEAAANAAEQFGAPEELGKNVAWAWRRERRMSRFSFCGAVALAWMLMCHLPGWALSLEGTFLMPWVHLNNFGARLRISLLETSAYFLAGALCGFAFPKRATTGTTLVAACFCLAHLKLWLDIPHTHLPEWDRVSRGVFTSPKTA